MKKILGWIAIALLIMAIVKNPAHSAETAKQLGGKAETIGTALVDFATRLVG